MSTARKVEDQTTLLFGEDTNVSVASRELRVISASSTAKAIEDGMKLTKKIDSIKDKEALTYPIGLKYGNQSWTIISALRELLSNMLDAKSNYNVEYVNGFAAISDQGEGLPKKAFILGESSRDDSQIGQFGEGLKMAMITALRLERMIFIQTAGFSIIVRPADMFDSTVMELFFVKNTKKVGTDIFVECTEAELKEAKGLFLALTELNRVDSNIYLPAGDVYVVGLKTASFSNMLFSYDLADKRLTNRDRNIVDANILNENIRKVWEGAKNQQVIKAYLEFANPNSYEYQIPFAPNANRMEVWQKVLAKLYPKAALSSDLRSDLHATMMGYTVLRNIPHNGLQILRKLGLKESSVYANSYNGEFLKDSHKMTFPVSTDYVSDWDRTKGIRELIANAIDAGDKITVRHNGEEARISDNGVGIVKKHFLFGISQKGNSAIGKFGEGLKVGCLVLARTGTPVTVETVGTTYEAKIEYNDEFDSDLLVIYYSKNNRTKGTSIVFKATESELEEAKAMFAQFQGRRTKVSTSNMDVYLDTPGVVYANGMQAAKDLDLFFSYDIKDKGIVDTRDRIHVDSYKVETYLRELYKYTVDERLIEKFLTAWQNGKTFLEYRGEFDPKDLTFWKKIAKKQFPKACLAVESSGYDNDDFIAKSAGYALLYNVPYCVKKILIAAGIQTADKVAKKNRNKGILLGDRLVYPITDSYAKQMTVADAIKELIANSLDTGCRASINYKDGVITISDKAEGLAKQNLLFGDSNKGEGDIGQFGEGLKLASLVLARAGRAFKVDTKYWSYEAKIEHDNQFNSDVLVLYLSRSKKRIGTDISFKGTEAELETAKKQFLVYNRDMNNVSIGVYIPGGQLYVNGVFIQNITSLFSYNLVEKDLIGRDRKTVDLERAKRSIAFNLNMMDNKKAIETLLTDDQYSNIEHNLSLNPTSAVRPLWKQITEKLYAKHCFATGTDYDGVARDKGFSLLMNMSGMLTGLLQGMGVRSADQVVKLRGDEGDINKRFDPKNLSSQGKKRWQKALSIFAKLYGINESKRIEIAAEFKYGVNTDSTWGLYNPNTGLIYVLVDLIEDVDHKLDTLMGVLIHEQVHRKSGFHDRTRDFEFALSMELGRIACINAK